MEITINQNDNQLIRIGNSNIQDINITEDENQEIGINNITPQSLNINQPETQTILIDGGGGVIGITDVLVNGVTVVSGNIAYITVPTKTSELQNNSGFITSETDPTVPSYVKAISLADINNWNNKQNALVSGSNIKTINNESLLGNGNIVIEGTIYSAGTGINIENNIINNEITSYNDLTDLPTIPTKTSDLINDSDFVSAENLSEVAFTGSYNSLSDTPIIPDSTSDLTNDSDFITSQEVSTEIQTAIATKQDILVSGTNIKTINNNSLLGGGNINITQPTKTSDLTNDGNGTYPFMLNKNSSHVDGIGTYGGSSAYQNNLSYVYSSGNVSEIKLVANFDDIPTHTSQLNNDSNYAVTNLDNNFTTNQTINGFITATNISNCIIKGISSSATANITSANGFGNIFIFSILYISMIQFQGANTNPVVIDIYGTHTFNTNMNNNTLELTNLNSWDHYIIIGTATIENITI